MKDFLLYKTKNKQIYNKNKISKHIKIFNKSISNNSHHNNIYQI